MSFRSLITGVSLAAVLLLGGCNKLRLGYEYADWLVIYSVEDNFELEKAQRIRFKDGVESYFNWHRKHMLPQYADLLSRAADSLSKGLRPEGLDSGYNQFQALYRKTMEPTVGRAVDLLLALTPAQVDQWQEKQQKKNQKLKKDFSGSREDQLERRYEKTLDELEEWTGRLTPEQKKQVRILSRGLPWNGHIWLEHREKVQTRLAGLLKNKAPREEIRKYLEDYLVYPERLRSQEYNARIKEAEAKTRTMVVRVHALLTAQQRKHFITKVDKLARDFRTMSRQE